MSTNNRFLLILSMLLQASTPRETINDIILQENGITNTKVFKKRLEKLQTEGRQLFTDKMYRTLGSSGGELIYKKQLSMFKEFLDLFKRPYRNDKEKFNARFEIFQVGLQRQAAMNKREARVNGSALYGINKYSDWTTEEFKLLTTPSFTFNKTVPDSSFIKHKSRTRRSAKIQHCSVSWKDIPQEVDWRPHSTKVKNQKNCGSCWAFVASEQVETYTAIKNNALPKELSPQELVSCAPSLGCKGGNTCLALYWLATKKQPLVTERTYPYEAKDSSCKTNKLKSDGNTVKAVCGCHSLKGREYLLLQVLAQKGPLAVNVDAMLWHDYIGGVVQHHCTSKKMNHAVQIVGYKLDGPVPYYIVRNQWGSSFGEDGYTRIKYGENICGVAEQPSFIVV